MNEFRLWLEEKQGDLVATLLTAVAAKRDARLLSHGQISALVLGLGVALKQGPSVLQNLLEQWSHEVESNAESGRWSAALMAIREAIWSEVIGEFSPAKAAMYLKRVESLLVEIIVLAATLDQQERADRSASTSTGRNG